MTDKPDYKKYDEARLEEMTRPGMRPIMDGGSPFYDDPDDIAWHLKDNAIRNIEAGQNYMTEVTLPYLESEAIARIKARINPLVIEPDKYKEPEYWRQKWVNEALCLEPHLQAYDVVAQAAVRVLLTASRLRSAIEDGSPEMIAALSMLLGCEVFTGSIAIEVATTKRDARAYAKVASKAQPFISGRREGTFAVTTKYLIEALRINPDLSADDVATYVFANAGDPGSPYDRDDSNAEMLYEKSSSKEVTRLQLVRKIYQARSRYLSNSGK